MRGILILSSLLLLAGCEGGPGRLPEGATGDAVKITYLRFVVPDKKTGKNVLRYWVLLSESWQRENGGWSETYGKTTKEPFHKICRFPFLNERVPDADMKALFAETMKKGFDTLPGLDPEKIDLRMLTQLAESGNRKKINAWRIISVQRGDYRKTAVYADILDPTCSQARSVPLNQAFLWTERLIVTSAWFRTCVQSTPVGPPFKWE